MLGQILDGRYKVIEELAAGGFAQTYLAEDTRLPGDPKCVVKHLNPSISDPVFLRKALELFKVEAETLQSLGKHDQIPQLFAYFEENDEFYLVQEFIEGHPLSNELLPSGKLPEPRVAKLIQDLSEILKFVHSYGVIHRDIKPNNIIRRHQDGKLVLIDFGTVKQVHTQLLKSHIPWQATLPIGTLGYMSSEQEQGNSCPNSDIYALGMVALQALTGMHPRQFPKQSSGAVVWRAYATVSKEFGTIIDKMVSYEPTQRYQTIDEVLRALSTLPNLPPQNQVALPAASESFTKLSQSKYPWQLLAGIAIGMIVVVGGLNLFKSLSVPVEPETATNINGNKLKANSTTALAPYTVQKDDNYNHLRAALKRQDWQSADMETYTLMLKVAGPKSYADGTYHLDELNNFSCADLVLIDQLWREYSDRKLGFSAQKQIYNAEGRDWQKAYEKLGWRTLSGEWLVSTRYNRQIKRWEYVDGHVPNFQNPSVGHLPIAIRETSKQSLAKNDLWQRCL